MAKKDLESENAELKRVLKEIQEITNDVGGYVERTNPQYATLGYCYGYPYAFGVVRGIVKRALKKVETGL